jgi:hypothetical protein
MDRLWTAPEKNPLANRTVLMAVQPLWLDTLIKAIQEEGGHPLPVNNEEEVFSCLQFEQPEFFILSEGLGREGSQSVSLLEYIQKMPTSQRREIFVVWIGRNVKPGDMLSAFSYSVNLVLQPEQLLEMTRLMKKAWSQWKDLYQVFLQTRLQLAGT